jgi:hypothetical protein
MIDLIDNAIAIAIVVDHLQASPGVNQGRLAGSDRSSYLTNLFGPSLRPLRIGAFCRSPRPATSSTGSPASHPFLLPGPAKAMSSQAADDTEPAAPPSKRRRVGLACNACRVRKSRYEMKAPARSLQITC